jgi:mitochondrial fission protein ELM1
MGLSPEKNHQLSLYLVDIYTTIERYLLLNMAGVIGQDRQLLLEAEDGTEYEQWRVLQLNKLGQLTDKQISIIAQHSRKAPEQIKRMLTEAGFTSIEDNEKIFKKAIEKDIIADIAPAVDQSIAILNILSTYERQAIDVMNMVNSTLIAQSAQIFIDAVNESVAMLLSGTITKQQTLTRIVRKWSDNGIPSLVDRAGRRWSTEAYVNMVARTTSNNVANDMQDARMDEHNVDLVLVSSHLGARPKCAPYQGKVFSRSGSAKRYPAWSTTSYGEPDGLLGINCRHFTSAYIHGVSVNNQTKYDSEENDKIYKESQQQRALERSIRHAKREQELMKKANDDIGLEKATKRLKERQAMMREFIRRTGSTRQYHREKIQN